MYICMALWQCNESLPSAPSALINIFKHDNVYITLHYSALHYITYVHKYTCVHACMLA